jgi:hypothetical protein
MTLHSRSSRNFPYPPMLRREQLRVRVGRLAYPEWSYGDLARHLNTVYRRYNGGCRSPSGVSELIKRKNMRIAV